LGAESSDDDDIAEDDATASESDDVEQSDAEGEVPQPPTGENAQSIASRCSEDVAGAQDHVFLWITRTSRKARCAGCGTDIPAWSFRLLFHPDPSKVKAKTLAVCFVHDPNMFQHPPCSIRQARPTRWTL
jgi:hypothetical protein